MLWLSIQAASGIALTTRESKGPFRGSIIITAEAV
jgi:hypothetical protein